MFLSLFDNNLVWWPGGRKALGAVVARGCNLSPYPQRTITPWVCQNISHGAAARGGGFDGRSQIERRAGGWWSGAWLLVTGDTVTCNHRTVRAPPGGCHGVGRGEGHPGCGKTRKRFILCYKKKIKKKNYTHRPSPSLSRARSRLFPRPDPRLHVTT